MPRAMPAIDAYLERVTESGLICHECGAEFMRPSGHPVSCSHCYAKLSLAEQKKYPLGVFRERNRVANEQVARERKRRRNAS